MKSLIYLMIPLLLLDQTLAIPQIVTKVNDIPEAEMLDILKEYNINASIWCNKNVMAEWNVATDTENEEYQNEQNQISLEYAKFKTDFHTNYIKDTVVENYKDEKIKRQLYILKDLGTAALNPEKLEELNKILSNMDVTYQIAEICPYDQQDCDGKNIKKWTLDPEMSHVLATSTNYDEMKYVWQRWREESGKKMREDYKKYVELVNEAATKNGYDDYGEQWRSEYGDPDFENTLERLWNEVEPLYNELHTYVRYKLLDIYKDDMDKDNKLIPAHILGNMWAQSWVNLYDRIKPFPNASLVDVTAKMKELNMSAKDMFVMSDEFYMSLGLPSSDMSYSEKAVIEKPVDRKIVCHASAWDFCDGEDFRIKMCTSINMEDFVTVHHEMGHIMYYQLYADQPLLFRAGATPAFHEAVGDTIALSVSTPKHLQKVNLLEDYMDTEADNINALFRMALERVAFLPFGLLIDKWRWDVFNKSISETEWNSHWWYLKEKYQKVYAPIDRTEDDFDPGAKYHVPANSQYIAYFGAHILEFQFYRSLCIEAGEYDPDNSLENPLHKCDFFENEKAGIKLRNGLKLGASEDWRLALEELAGESEISGKALLEYFQPLYEFLKAENKELKTLAMQEVLHEYNEQNSKACNKQVSALYATQVDVGNDELQEELNEIIQENTEFVLKNYDTHFADIDLDDYTDDEVQRQLKYLTQISINKLSTSEITELNTALGRMQSIYSSARICPYDNQSCDINNPNTTLSLNPDLNDIMANSVNYQELLHVWKEWRDNTGLEMKEDYDVYLRLMNKAAEFDGFEDMGELWRDDFEQENFIEDMKKLWSELQPLYNELHKYVRRHLIEIYGDNMDKNSDLIPAHLLGNMWAQSWTNLYDRIKPFKNTADLDITNKLKEKNYSVLDLFDIANDFYAGLGLPNNSMSYDVLKGAVIEKPLDKIVTCHASAWDFCDQEDYRIKMCTRINMEDFLVIHHEMGHISYYLLYKDQPLPLRGGANPGFHEAVGDTISLSVSTPKHLSKLGLLDSYEDSYEDNINALFKKALERVAFLPYGLLMDLWRWELFSGDVDINDWNKRWWDLREEYQKVSAPLPRNDDDFDPGSKYHIPYDTQYISYFIAHILDMQLYRALCLVAGDYAANDPDKPLHKCDFDGSIEAGNRLKAGLSLGKRKHWTEALEEITGERELKSDALLEYFKPLYEFLEAENKKYTENDGTTNIVGIVIGSVVGALAVIAIAGFGIYYYKKKTRSIQFV